MPETRVKPRAKPQRKPAPPGVMLLAGEPVVLPEGRVAPGAWPELALAVLLEPEPAELPAWVGRLEARLGVRPEHRAAIERRAMAEVEARAHRERRMQAEAARVAGLSAPVRDPELTALIAKTAAALAKAKADLEDPPGLTERQKRKAAKVARARVSDLAVKLAELQRKEADLDRLFGPAKEVILLARARGEDVVAREATTAEWVRDENGARVLERVRGEGRYGSTYLRPVLAYGTGLRARKLSGIDHAHDAGYLGENWREAERLHKVGVDYREAYEAVEGHKGRAGEGGGGAAGPKAPQPRQIELGQALADMRRGLTRRQRDVLDLVCGEDMRLRDAMRVLGIGDPRTAERALVTGLNAAAAGRAEAIALRQARGEAPAGANVAAANAALRRMRVL